MSKKHLRRMTIDGYLLAKLREEKKLYGCKDLFFYIDANNRNPEQVQTAIWENILYYHLQNFNYN